MRQFFLVAPKFDQSRTDARKGKKRMNGLGDKVAQLANNGISATIRKPTNQATDIRGPRKGNQRGQNK